MESQSKSNQHTRSVTSPPLTGLDAAGRIRFWQVLLWFRRDWGWQIRLPRPCHTRKRWPPSWHRTRIMFRDSAALAFIFPGSRKWQPASSLPSALVKPRTRHSLLQGSSHGHGAVAMQKRATVVAPTSQHQSVSRIILESGGSWLYWAGFCRRCSARPWHYFCEQRSDRIKWVFMAAQEVRPRGRGACWWLEVWLWAWACRLLGLCAPAVAA
jgi:hypothetical protein